jgi:3-oxoacyl-[acyl-carrier-protein] synthase II
LNNRRVVITGIGIIGAIGTDTDSFWENGLKGKSNVTKIPEHWFNYASFNSDIWSPLPEIDFSGNGITTRIEQKRLDKSSLISIKTASNALDDGQLQYNLYDKKRNSYLIDGIDNEKAGIFMGTGVGGINTVGDCCSYHLLSEQKNYLNELINQNDADNELNRILRKVHDKIILPKRFNPFAVSMIMPNAVSANLGIKFNLNGINNTFSLSCASGTIAIGNAYKTIKSGEIDFTLAGGVEYVTDNYGAIFYGFDKIKALISQYDSIEDANKPFDINRSGFLFSEGGGATLILEDLEHAKKRNAKIIAEILGYGETFDAHNIMMINPDGKNIKRMIETTLKKSNLTPGDIDYINTHGTGTELNDEVESKIIDDIFFNKPFINSTKSLIGHTLGASGAIEAAVTALSIKNKTSHICKNLEQPVRDLNFIRSVDELPIKKALTHSFGFGGHNACLILGEFN